MGVETEYGIAVPGRPLVDPVLLSGRVVQRYAAGGHGRVHRTRWDYAGESPLEDARGFSVSRALAHESQLTDEWADDPRVANVVLTNGARLYVDHAHPEYSAPEVTSPREVLVWDRAGEVVMAEAARVGSSDLPDEPPVEIYKNNTDGKGASYGTHENYLVARATPFERLVDQITPFFVARQILCGAGRVGLGQNSETPGYQISSRADFFEARVGLETTFRRPIVNTRDEPHAHASRYRRLHVIIGDANLSEVSALLKVGTTSLVLALIESGRMSEDLSLVDPVGALKAISHDPDLTTTVELVDGRRLAGLQLLRRYEEHVHAHLRAELGGDPLALADDDTREVLTRWDAVLTALETGAPEAARWVEWVAKRQVLEGFRARDGLGWDDPRLLLVDLQWSHGTPGKGLARRLEARGRLERLTTEEEIDRAVDHAPPTTRAWFRGECVRRHPDAVVAASWQSILLDRGDGGPLQRIATPEPLKGTRALTEALLDRHPDVEGLLTELTAGGAAGP
ncbi:depupylase/deamidase Dop [Mobilicoccus pelagius]|uniref:Putative proteasome accessory factor n=1 Tax=Mobilicoccus pelagius NBRC 104925 TaxID=1089455 RepID=H5UTG3_9MICO|nr:depupylase/deamidase Dop [Mobilicoccus pelagius]GAB49021.1 putative proteasome accessory factor [Mobilicoccus pelagius NBRC 104925]